MTPEKQRIAIAEACGWTVHSVTNANKNGWMQQTIPDYLNSLDAMHEAEKVLDDDQFYTFTLKLCDMGLRSFPDHIGELGHINHRKRLRIYCSATAAQRSEAFLKTIGKWEETPEPDMKEVNQGIFGES